MLTLVFADEREGPSVASALHFGRFDVATGTWLVEPRVALPDAGFVTNVALARSSEGYAVVFTRTNAVTIPVVISGFTGGQGSNWGRACALSMVATLPVFILVLLLQRHLVRGLTLGAVRG